MGRRKREKETNGEAEKRKVLRRGGKRKKPRRKQVV